LKFVLWAVVLATNFDSQLRLWVRNFSVWPIRSESFRSRDFSVLIVPVSRHFGQAMKSCRNLICSLFNANVLKSTNGFL